jgi:hypothetical protein
MVLARYDNAYSAALWGGLVQETRRIAKGKRKSMSKYVCGVPSGVNGRNDSVGHVFLMLLTDPTDLSPWTSPMIPCRRVEG